MNSLEVQQYLDSFINHEKSLHISKPSSFKLDRVQALLELLDNPQNELKIIHVAGSKGKGSVCAMTATILKEAGFKVGLYTSPHLNTYRERIRILDQNKKDAPTNDIFNDLISDEELTKTIEEIKPAIEKIKNNQQLGQLTFYEIFTALALYYFQRENVDFVVLETGLGGRLDATNVCESLVCAITSISLEHTNILGSTLSQIAKEKAAIIKNGRQKVVIANQADEVKEVLEHRCKQFQLQPRVVDYNMHYQLVSQDVREQRFSLATKQKHYQDLSIPLLGQHQLINASVAVGIIESLQDLGENITEEAISLGLKNVFWPGRCEILNTNPTIILDGAHNGEAMRQLVQTIKKIFPDKECIVILGIAQDKDLQGICQSLNEIARCIIFTEFDHPRSWKVDLQSLSNFFTQQPHSRASNITEAFQQAYEDVNGQQIILVTGSIFVVGEARRLDLTQFQPLSKI